MASCALSGNVPEEPVVSIKTGHMYEKRMILKHIEATGQCPMTRAPMTVDDLITVKTSSSYARPRPPTATSFPALLQLLQTEWDASVLEGFNLKRNVDMLRQELAHSMYQLDAANRVIARLMKERDEAQSALAQVDSTVRSAVAAQAMADEPAAAPATGVSAELAAAFTARATQLSSTRHAQVKAASAAAAGNLAKLASLAPAPASAVTLHSTTEPGITALAPFSGAVAVAGAGTATVVATGGADGTVTLFDASTGRQLTAVEAVHAKPVTALAAWADDAVGPVVAVSGAADCTAALLRAASPSAALVATPLVGHSGEVTAADVHPTGCVVATGARDGSLRLWDAESGRAAAVFTHAELGPVTAMQFHPDGLFAVVGDAEGRILLIELIELKVAGTMHGHKAAVTAVACSPKGYILATGDAAGQVCVWDLRTQTVITTLAPGAGSATEGAPVLSLRFDGASGSALIAALGSGFVAYKAGKTWSVVATALPLDAASADAAHACIGALFGPNLGSVVTAGAGKDRTLRVFNV